MRIHINITGELLHQIDELIEKGTYGSRTEIVRDGIRRILENQRPREPFIRNVLKEMDERRKDDEKLYGNLTYEERLKLHKEYNHE